MTIGDTLTGREADRISGLAFKIMSFLIKLSGKFMNVERTLDQFGIQPGFTVIDYGCGPGNYIKRASESVGDSGEVIAVDIHPLAGEEIENIKRKNSLNNVSFVLAEGYPLAIEDGTADMIYALDMFHMVSDHKAFLTELHRLLKSEGYLIIEDGHQPRESSKEKIIASGLWEIVSETKRNMKCLPK